MKAHARQGFERVYRQARLTTLFVPVGALGAMVNNVLKVVHSFPAPDKGVTNLESGVSTFFMPHPHGIQN
eukprot:3091578-Amphidinium_carterae.2